jgi:hypothetical protein
MVRIANAEKTAESQNTDRNTTQLKGFHHGWNV